MSVPHQRGVVTGVEIKIDDSLRPEDVPSDVMRAFAEFVAASSIDPKTFQRALRNGTVLASPQQIIGNSGHFTNPGDEQYGEARRIMANFFLAGADRFVRYDEATEEAIRDGINKVDVDIARSWRLDKYLGLYSLMSDGQTGDALPPPSPYPSFGEAA